MSNQKTAELDRIDLRMLDLLQHNGRITNSDLAEKINLSASACYQRLQRLIADGWINDFQGRLNIEKISSPVQCIATICLSNHNPESFNILEQKISDMPQVLDAYTVSGACDFVVRFACTQMTEYMALTEALIQNCPYINNISTHVVMRQSKYFNGFPLRELLPDDKF